MRPARAPGIFLLAVLAAGPAPAQTQDRTMLERVTAIPDMSLVNPMQGKKFEGSPGLAMKKARGMDREFSTRAFTAPAARPTRSFLGIRNPWLGPLVYPSAPAWLPARTIPNAQAAYPVRRFPSGEYADERKTLPEVRRAVPVRPFSGRGGAQGALDLIGEAARRELTPDELRELLNKPR